MGVFAWTLSWEDEHYRWVVQRSMVTTWPFAGWGLCHGLAKRQKPLAFASLFGMYGFGVGLAFHGTQLMVGQLVQSGVCSLSTAGLSGAVLGLAGGAAMNLRRSAGAKAWLLTGTAACAQFAFVACALHSFADWAVDRLEHSHLKRMRAQGLQLESAPLFLRERYALYLAHKEPEYLGFNSIRGAVLAPLRMIPGVTVSEEWKGFRGYWREEEDDEDHQR
uniref:Uncharacterized protein n=1 Tax=Eutreptiella gymnastica TaxID=73025 RepID=A0A7S1NXN9_9EUGL|mmetsp:Transcript_99940/g.172404  ORF Transcript_99940/g.172404 Transcript_99940/m.172404 type:complete len:220 (+) Transcript_99940:24-683(+)